MRRLTCLLSVLVDPFHRIIDSIMRRTSMETNGGDHKTITHDFPVWREKANFILAAHLDDPDVPKKWKWEQIWARQIQDNVFEICCIPFVTYGLALGDLVGTEPLNERTFVINKVLEKKGHTTYRIWFLDMDKWKSVTEAVRDLGCSVEIRWEKSKLIAIDAPTDEIAKLLNVYVRELEADGVAKYEIGI